MAILSKQPVLSPDLPKEENMTILIKEFKYKSINNKQMAKLMNFSPFQLDMIDTFWDAAKKKGRLYLGDEIILEYMEQPLKDDQNGYKIVRDFFDKKLRKKFTLNIDYFIIDKNNTLVEHYYQTFCVAKSSKQRISGRGGHNKAFYAVTNECYVKLLMMAKTEAGEEAREYFLSLQFMMTLMKKYHKRCMQKQLETFEADNKKIKADNEKLKLIEGEKKKLEEEKLIAQKRMTNMQRVINYTEMINKQHFIYIVVRPSHFKNDINGMGKTDDPIKRLALYNAKNSGEDLAYFAYCKRCHDAHQIENTLRKLLKRFLVKDTLDMFYIRYDYLEKMIDAAVEGQSTLYEIYNDYVKLLASEQFYSDHIEQPKNALKSDPTESEETTEEEIVLDDLSDDELKKKAKRIIENYIQDNYYNEFNYDRDRDTSFSNVDDPTDAKLVLDVYWNDLKIFIKKELNMKMKKVTRIRNTIKELSDMTQLIKFIERTPRK